MPVIGTVALAWCLVPAEDLDDSFTQQIAFDLAADLARVGIELAKACERAVFVDRAHGDTVVISVAGVARELDLSAIPPDGRALAVAVAAGELVRASYGRPVLEELPPLAPFSVQVVPLEEPLQFNLSFGARFAFEAYQRGQTQLGGDAYLRYRWDRIGAELAFGWRGALNVASANGSITGDAIGGSAALSLAIIDAGLFSLELDAGVRGAWVRFRGDASGDATDRSDAGVAWIGRGGVRATLAIDPIAIEAAAGGGYAFRGVLAGDGSEAVTGVAGAEIYFTAGIGWML